MIQSLWKRFSWTGGITEPACYGPSHSYTSNSFSWTAGITQLSLLRHRHTHKIRPLSPSKFAQQLQNLNLWINLNGVRKRFLRKDGARCTYYSVHFFTLYLSLKFVGLALYRALKSLCILSMFAIFSKLLARMHICSKLWMSLLFVIVVVSWPLGSMDFVHRCSSATYCRSTAPIWPTKSYPWRSTAIVSVIAAAAVHSSNLCSPPYSKSMVGIAAKLFLISCLSLFCFAVVVGSLFGFYGLCSSMLTGIYVGPFNNTDLAGYQLFMAISTAIVSVIAAVGLKPFRTDTFSGIEEETTDPLLGGESYVLISATSHFSELAYRVHAWFSNLMVRERLSFFCIGGELRPDCAELYGCAHVRGWLQTHFLLFFRNGMHIMGGFRIKESNDTYSRTIEIQLNCCKVTT